MAKQRTMTRPWFTTDAGAQTSPPPGDATVARASDALPALEALRALPGFCNYTGGRPVSDVAAALYFFVTVELLGLAVWPLVRAILHRLPDRGWAFAKFGGVLLTTWLSWTLSRIRALSYSRSHTVALALVVAAACWGWASLDRRKNARFLVTELKRAIVGPDRNWFIIGAEIIYIAAYFVWAGQRARKPELLDLEKFMNIGFIASALKTQYFPPLDQFLAREAINYYYFGHVIAATIIQLSGTRATVGYNLQMANVLGLGMAEAFSLGAGVFWAVSSAPKHCLAKRALWAGVGSATFSMLLGNLHWLIYAPLRGKMYWFADATRYIPNTIHEFPAYSFVVNDLHGHVSNIPTALWCVALAFLMFQTLASAAPSVTHTSAQASASSARPVRAVRGVWPFAGREQHALLAASAVCVGACYVINAWDYPIYLLLFGCVFWSSYAAARARETGRRLEQGLFDRVTLARTAIASILLVGGTIVPWGAHWIDMRPPSQGIGFVTWSMRTPPLYVPVVWGIQGFFAAAYLAFKRAQRKYASRSAAPENELRESGAFASAERFGFLEVLILLAVVLITLCELIYVKDIYPGHPRANTMFKLYYQAWIMFGIFCGSALVMLWTELAPFAPRWVKPYKAVTVVLIFAGVACSLKANAQYTSARNTPQRTLDGAAFLATMLPGDAKAIQWINANIPGQPTNLGSGR